MPEQAQKKISKEAARLIFLKAMSHIGNFGPSKTVHTAASVLQELDELVEDGGLDTVGLFLRQASRKGLVDGEDVERIESRQARDFLGDSGDLGAPDELVVRNVAGLLALVLPSEIRKDAGLVKTSREREANRAGLNGRNDDLHRLVFVQGDAYFF